MSKRTLSEDDAELHRFRTESKALETDEFSEDEEDPSLLMRDPADWKTQDHYAVLGISKLRYKASFSQIKAACNENHARLL